MTQFQRCQDSIEQLKKQRPWYEVFSDDDGDDGRHWEDWEIEGKNRILTCTNPFVVLLTFSQTSPGLQNKSFENIEEKGEIAHNEQFLLFPQCFLPILRTFSHFI